MKYFLFLDECGDQNLRTFNPDFPIFTLCGVVISENNYHTLAGNMEKLKQKYWSKKNIILHSRDIRKCQKGFEILFDLNVKKQFYEDINQLISDTKYEIITCSILKQEYIKKYGRLDDVYGKSLSFIMERTVFLLDNYDLDVDAELHLISEKRGKREDKELLSYYNSLLDSGTYYVNPERMRKYFKEFHMRWKRENIAGLQLADLLAYPIARHCLSPDDVNFSYDVLVRKIYQKKGMQYGLKIFPNE